MLCMILCKIGELAAWVKKHSNAWYACVFSKIYKIMHKAYVNKKATNAVISAFVAFPYISKLAFGNYIFFQCSIISS